MSVRQGRPVKPPSVRQGRLVKPPSVRQGRPVKPPSVPGPQLAARLTRRREGRWLAGVCNGLAGALGVQVGALRAVVVLLALASLPAVALLYALAWVFLPPESDVDCDAGADDRPGGGRGAADPAAPAGGLVIDGRPADLVDG